MPGSVEGPKGELYKALQRSHTFDEQRTATVRREGSGSRVYNGLVWGSLLEAFTSVHVASFFISFYKLYIVIYILQLHIWVPSPSPNTLGISTSCLQASEVVNEKS